MSQLTKRVLDVMPSGLRRPLGHAVGRLRGGRHATPAVALPRRCNLCRQDVTFRSLDPIFTTAMSEHGFPHPVSDFETMNYEEYACPSCGSTDRDRLYAIYLQEYLAARAGEDVDVLEIAPSPVLRKFLSRKPTVRYRCADLLMPNVDDQVDMTNMSCYPDGRFDFVICSHVLEHVDDDRKALAELRRILKPGGGAIVMTPVIDRPDVFDEDPSVTDPAERWRRFGQGDHVRLYSKRILVDRMSDAGFDVAQLGSAHFGVKKMVRHGIATKSVLYVLTRPADEPVRPR